MCIRDRDAQERTRLTELGEIARGIAHSLRNPLHALGLSVADLAEAPADADRREALAGTCRLQIENIDRTLRSFLSLAAANAEPPRPVDLVDVVQDVVMEVAQTAAGRVHVNCELGEGRPMVRGIAAELRTALHLSLIHISEPTRLLSISYAVFCLKKK